MNEIANNELHPSLVRELTGVANETALRINARRASIGLGPMDIPEVVGRSVRFVELSDAAVRLWNSPSLVVSRQTELNLHPSVRQLGVDCVDGRIGRAKKGAMPGLKTEHGHVSLMRSPSTGLWYPSDVTIQMALEQTEKTPQQILRVHNHHCAAWALTVDDLRAEVWEYVTPEQKTHILAKSRQEPVLGNATFSELTAGLAINRYYRDVHGLDKPIKIATTLIYDLYTTGVELVTPLVNYDGEGNFVGFPQDSEIRRRKTTELVTAVEEYKARSGDENLPEPGKYKDDYFKFDVFPKFAAELTDLTVALCKGVVQTGSDTWIASRTLLEIRERMVDSFIREGYPDMPIDLQQALDHKFVHAAMREYLLKGQTHTHNHKELHGSASADGSNVGKYSPEHQTIRIHCPDLANAERRMVVGTKVMDGNGIDGANPHIFYIVGSTPIEARRLYSQLVQRAPIEELITEGKLFPIGGVLDADGKFVATLQQSVRGL